MESGSSSSNNSSKCSSEGSLSDEPRVCVPALRVPEILGVSKFHVFLVAAVVVSSSTSKQYECVRSMSKSRSRRVVGVAL